MSAVKQDRNIHEKGNHKLYRMWYPNKRDNIKVTLDVENSIYDFYLHDNMNHVASFTVDSKLPILGLYHTFMSKVAEMEA